jgi:hypothetical protein
LNDFLARKRKKPVLLSRFEAKKAVMEDKGLSVASHLVARLPDRKNGINLIPSRYHWDQLDAKVIVLDINFPVRSWATTVPERATVAMYYSGFFGK